MKAKRDEIIILWQNARELSVPVCIDSYQQMTFKVHSLAYENEYSLWKWIKILEKCGIHLTRGIFISEVCIFIFGIETESHAQVVWMLVQMLHQFSSFLWYQV